MHYSSLFLLLPVLHTAQGVRLAPVLFRRDCCKGSLVQSGSLLPLRIWNTAVFSGVHRTSLSDVSGIESYLADCVHDSISISMCRGTLPIDLLCRLRGATCGLYPASTINVPLMRCEVIKGPRKPCEHELEGRSSIFARQSNDFC